jgi:hypothetical protein
MNADKKPPAEPAATTPQSKVDDADVAGSIRGLVRGSLKAALATLDAKSGHPYASLVTVATSLAGNPVFLISKLALHTQNLIADPRASLLFDATDGHADPLAGARATAIGRARITTDPFDRTRMIARHSGAARTADFPDFAFWTLDIERAHYIGGFGRIRTLPAEALAGPPVPQGLGEAETGLVATLNQSLAPFLAAIEVRPKSGQAWRICGVDAEGIDLTDGASLRRSGFPHPAASISDIAGLSEAALRQT